MRIGDRVVVMGELCGLIPRARDADRIARALAHKATKIYKGIS